MAKQLAKQRITIEGISVTIPRKVTKAVGQRYGRYTSIGDADYTHMRFSKARNARYVPLKNRPKHGRRANKYERMACSAGAWAAFDRGYNVRPKATCGPRTMGSSRAHKLLGYWRGILNGNAESVEKFMMNPRYPDVPNAAFVYDTRKDGKVDWALIDPLTDDVLTDGTSKNMQAALKSAHSKLRKMTLG